MAVRSRNSTAPAPSSESQLTYTRFMSSSACLRSVFRTTSSLGGVDFSLGLFFSVIPGIDYPS